jgi:hypothetical protein
MCCAPFLRTPVPLGAAQAAGQHASVVALQLLLLP